MSKTDDALRELILYHSKRVGKELVGGLPGQMRQMRRDIRSLEKALSGLARTVERLAKVKQEEAPVQPAPDDELQKARYSKRTLPSLRKRFGLTQKELAGLLEVAPLTIASWEQGKARPRKGSLAQIVALRSMDQAQLDAALNRQPIPPAMKPAQIKGLRGRLGLTQRELGELLGVTALAAGSWERGKSSPGEDSRRGLARIEGMTRDQADQRLGRKKPVAAVTAQATVASLSPARIKDIRTEAGLSQKALAEALKVSPNSVWNWETGNTAPREASVKKLLAIGK